MTDSLVESYLALIHRIARPIYGSIEHRVELDELVSMGVLGLLDAASRVDPESTTFTGYAYKRIHGAIYDNLDGLLPLPRHTYRLVKAGKLTAFSIATDPHELDLSIASTGRSIEGRLDANRAIRALRRLPDRLSALLHAFYFHDRTMTEIAERLELSVSRVSRLHKRAIDQLRELLEASSARTSRRPAPP